MIVLQSTATGLAEQPVVHRKSAAGMSSPGGEEAGEGELHSDSAGRTTRAFSCAAAVPKGQSKIARHFSAGIPRIFPQVPTGRLNFRPLSPFPSLHQGYPISRIKANQGFSR